MNTPETPGSGHENTPADPIAIRNSLQSVADLLDEAFIEAGGHETVTLAMSESSEPALSNYQLGGKYDAAAVHFNYKEIGGHAAPMVTFVFGRYSGSPDQNLPDMPYGHTIILDYDHDTGQATGQVLMDDAEAAAQAGDIAHGITEVDMEEAGNQIKEIAASRSVPDTAPAPVTTGDLQDIEDFMLILRDAYPDVVRPFEES